MKIYLKNKRIVCSTEEMNRGFWREAEYDLFAGGVTYIQRYAMIEPVGHEYETAHAACVDLFTLDKILRLAGMYGIEVDEAVIRYRDTLRASFEKLYAEEKAAQEKEKRREKWETKCRSGCYPCENLCYNVDAPFCAATVELLEEKNEPCYRNGTYYLFSFVAYPTQGCPYNPEKSKGGETET